MHTLEAIVDTKYGPRKVTGLLAAEYNKGRVEEVVAFIERAIEENKIAQRRSSNGLDLIYKGF